ncbi:MAG: nucleotidyltransferase domain-containing protein [Candidatus Micrarchaeota archaeon]
MLERMFKSRLEVAVLGVVLFSNDLHLSEIARRAGISVYGARRELENLVGIGVLERRKRGNQVAYSAKSSCTFFQELRSLYIKTEGAVPLLREKLQKMRGIDYAFVFGSFASGKFGEKSDLDVMVIGSMNIDELGAACLGVQKKTMREINYIAWTNEEFAKKAKEGGAFINSLVANKKIWLVGGEDGFNKFKRNAEEAGNRKG